MAGASLLTGCTTGIYGVKVPLNDKPDAVYADASHVTIEDTRAAEARRTHVGGGLSRCERWYGDDAYQPPKLVYLDHLIAARVPASTPVKIRLDVFDTLERCDNFSNRSTAGLIPGVVPKPIPGGDSVNVQVAGEINGVPFNASRSFDYSSLPYKELTQMPSDNPTYRELMHKLMDEIADEIVGKLPPASTSSPAAPGSPGSGVGSND
jgi:hypothetical protein